MPVRSSAVRAACQHVDAAIRSDPRYAHTSAFRVVVDDALVHESVYGRPSVAEVFSVTKTVVATLTGMALRLGRLRDIDEAVDPWVRAACGVDLAGTPSAGQTWRQLLTMTRGSKADGPYDIDAVMSLPSGWVQRIADAPRIDEPGSTFRYDNGAGHLLSAALTGVLASGVDRFADRELFEPLAIDGACWLRDPDGIAMGSGFLRLRAVDLSSLGQLWLDGGRWRGRQLVDPEFATAMVSRQSDGGPPESSAYGFCTWVEDDYFFAGGWAGQHVMVVPAARAVVVVTGHPRFRPGPPPTDELPADWRPAKDLVVTYLLPALRAA